MPFKDWPELAPPEVKAALMDLSKRDVGDGPGQINLTRFISLIAQAGLSADPDILAHLKTLQPAKRRS